VFLECRRYPKELSSQRKQRSRPLKLQKISQGEGGSSQAQEGAQLPLDQLERRDLDCYQSLILSVYCRQREPEEKEDRVLKLCDDCCKVRNSQ
jgi:hypothetical protein